MDTTPREVRRVNVNNTCLYNVLVSKRHPNGIKFQMYLAYLWTEVLQTVVFTKEPKELRRWTIIGELGWWNAFSLASTTCQGGETWVRAKKPRSTLWERTKTDMRYVEELLFWPQSKLQEPAQRADRTKQVGFKLFRDRQAYLQHCFKKLLAISWPLTGFMHIKVQDANGTDFSQPFLIVLQTNKTISTKYLEKFQNK